MHPAQSLGIVSLVLFALGSILPFLLFTNSDPAGNAMMGGLAAFVFWAGAIVLAIIAFIKSFRGNLSIAARVVGRAPLLLILLVIAVGVVVAINS